MAYPVRADRRFRLTNSVAKLAPCGITLDRPMQAWLFAGSDCRGEWAASMCSLTVVAELNDVDLRDQLADMLHEDVDHSASRRHDLLI